MAVEFVDNSAKIKGVMEEVARAWLHETGNEVASKAKDTCTFSDDGGQLKGSYRADVNAGKGVATIGTPLEQGWWEEWGTGEHAAHGDGRKGWWVYIEGKSDGEGGKEYKTKAEAERGARFLRVVKRLPAKVTNGREPNYTLEKAFKTQAPKMERRLQQMLDERFGK